MSPLPSTSSVIRRGILGTAALLLLVPVPWAGGHASESPSDSPAPNWPPHSVSVTDLNGRPLEVGDVIAQLREENGSCVTTEPIGMSVSSEGAWDANVAYTFDSDCRVVVTEIDYFRVNGKG